MKVYLLAVQQTDITCLAVLNALQNKLLLGHYAEIVRFMSDDSCKSLCILVCVCFLRCRSQWCDVRAHLPLYLTCGQKQHLY